MSEAPLPPPVPPRAETTLPRRPRPPEVLGPALMRRFADAGRWSRGVGLTMLILGGLLLLSAGFILIKGDFTGLLTGAISAVYLVPGGFLYGYGRRIDVALDYEPSINIEFALVHARRYWIAMTTCALLLVVATVFLSMIPNLRAAINMSRLKLTATRMAEVRDALEGYAIVHHSYPAATEYGVLLKELKPIKADLPRLDAWDNQFRYVPTCGDGYCWEYSLTSAGADRKFDTPSAPDGGVILPTRPECDLVVSNGRFTRAPQAWMGR